MGCIMTPMPNHLSTLKPHHNRVENTPGRTGEKKRAVWGRIEEKKKNNKRRNIYKQTRGEGHVKKKI